MAELQQTVTLTSSNTNYQLSSLLSGSPNLMLSELTITGYPGIDGTGQNSKDVLIGTSGLSTTNFGAKVAAGQSETFRAGDKGCIDPTQIYVRSAGASQQLLVNGRTR